MDKEKSIERVKRLINKAEDVISTHRPNPPNVIGFHTLDSGTFASWRNQALSCIQSTVCKDHLY